MIRLAPLLLMIAMHTVSCTSVGSLKNTYHLDAIQKFKIGDKKSEVIRSLGQPNSSEPNADGSTLTYSISYKRVDIPKVVVRLDSEERVVSKEIFLFEETNDSFTLEKSEQFVGKGNFVAQKSAPPPISHHLSKRVEMDYLDSERGIALQVERSDLNRVRSILWNSPKPLDAGMVTEGHQ